MFCLFVLVWCCYWCWASTNTSTVRHLQYPTLLDQIRLVFLSRPQSQNNHVYGPQVIYRRLQLQMQNFPSVIQRKAECPPPASAELKARRILHNVGVHAVSVDRHKSPGNQKKVKPSQTEPSKADSNGLFQRPFSRSSSDTPNISQRGIGIYASLWRYRMIAKATKTYVLRIWHRMDPHYRLPTRPVVFFGWSTGRGCGHWGRKTEMENVLLSIYETALRLSCDSPYTVSMDWAGRSCHSIHRLWKVFMWYFLSTAEW